jgi:hypothetical protein
VPGPDLEGNPRRVVIDGEGVWAGTEQGALFGVEERTPEWTEAQGRLMDALDAANRKFGRRAVAFAAMGPPSALRKTRDGSAGAPRWETRRERMSPRYTKRWDQIVTVSACPRGPRPYTAPLRPIPAEQAYPPATQGVRTYSLSVFRNGRPCLSASGPPNTC